MPIALRSVMGQGYSAAAPSEFQFVVGTASAWAGRKPPLIYCHGSGATTQTAASGSAANAGEWALLTALAQHYLVIVADLGLQAWGNDTHVARIAEAKAYLAALGATGPVTLVGGSMGNLGALGYARAHPESVSKVACIIPALDLASLYPMASADIDAAYGGAYSNAVHGPTHSPVQYAASLDADLPIHLFTTSNDPVCLPSTASAFVSARPQTGRTDLGALGHGDAAAGASASPVVEWLHTS